MGFVTGAREMKKESRVQTVKKYEGEGLLGRISSRWENIIETDLTSLVLEISGWLL